MKNNRIKRILAYIYMPVFFMILGYGVLALAFSPFYELGAAAASMLIADQAPTFGPNLTSIFNPEEAAQNEARDTVPLADVPIPSFETQYGELSCSRIGLDVPLFYGDSDAAVDNGVGQNWGSLMPGFGGTILVAGHNQTYFLPLKDIEIGDVIKITTNYGTYEYEVVELTVHHHASEEAVDFLQTDKEQLVLYTCWPFHSIGSVKQERLFVYADKISGPEVV